MFQAHRNKFILQDHNAIQLSSEIHISICWKWLLEGEPPSAIFKENVTPSEKPFEWKCQKNVQA